MPTPSRNQIELQVYGEFLPEGSEVEAQAIEEESNKQQLKSQYQTVVSRLQQIIDADSTGWTQAQFNQQALLAIKDIAKFVLWIIKFIARFLT